jgi:hypothetical protein
MAKIALISTVMTSPPARASTYPSEHLQLSGGVLTGGRLRQHVLLVKHMQVGRSVTVELTRLHARAAKPQRQSVCT